MDPYSYVGNNPETRNDPTGQRFCDPTGKNCGAPCGGSCTTPGSGGGSGGDHWVCNSVGCYDNGVLMYTRPVPTPSSCGGCKWVHPGFQPVVKKGPTPQQIADGQTKAYNTAGDAAQTFIILGTIFTLLGVFAAVAAGMGWFAAPILLGLVAAFGMLAAQAFIIAAIFGGEGRSTGAHRDINYGWFTSANIQNQLNIIDGIATGMMSIFSGAAFKWFAALGGDAALASAEGSVVANASFGLTFGLTELFGGLMLQGVATYYGNIQENAVLT